MQSITGTRTGKLTAMKNFFSTHRGISIFILAVIAGVLIITAYSCKGPAIKSIPDDIPKDVYEFLISYLETCKNDPDQSDSYCHFEEEDERKAYRRSYIEIIGYDVIDSYPLSENLYGFHVHMEREETEYSRDYYLFVGKIEDQLYLMNHVYNVPEEMRSVIDEEMFQMFTYDGTLIPYTSILG